MLLTSRKVSAFFEQCRNFGNGHNFSIEFCSYLQPTTEEIWLSTADHSSSSEAITLSYTVLWKVQSSYRTPYYKCASWLKLHHRHAKSKCLSVTPHQVYLCSWHHGRKRWAFGVASAWGVAPSCSPSGSFPINSSRFLWMNTAIYKVPHFTNKYTLTRICPM